VSAPQLPQEAFVADIGPGEPIDLLPLAEEMLTVCPYRHDLTALEVAQLTAHQFFGKYIPVDVQDRVEGRRLSDMISHIFRRIYSAHRIEQKRELVQLVPWKKYFELVPGEDVCPSASTLTGKFIDIEDMQPLPFSKCWGFTCMCDYRGSSARELERKGRVDESGRPMPSPFRPVFCAVEDGPKDNRKISPLFQCRTTRELGTR
jgi:hypothetical protein